MPDMRGEGGEAEVGEASRARRRAADALDAALAMGVVWLLHRGGRLVPARNPAASAAVRLLAPSGALVREQLTSPGQRLLGLRTVDRRSGRRVAAWRTLVVLGMGAGSEWLAWRMAPRLTPEQELRRERYTAELGAIYRRHPNDPEGRAAELSALAQNGAPAPQVNLWRAIAPGLAAALATGLVRRRLTPTVDVLSGRQSP